MEDNGISFEIIGAFEAKQKNFTFTQIKHYKTCCFNSQQ